MPLVVSSDQTFGRLLKHWRSQRNFSQLHLSMASDVSQRHISFIESGRSRPSRNTILKLAAVLDIPLRQQNQMLTTAGFASVYSEFDLSAPEVEPIRKALELMLRQQEPYPAFVMDRYWNQMTTNEGAAKLFSWVLGEARVPEFIGLNLMKLFLHPEGAKPYVGNWAAIVPQLIHRVHRESLAEGQDERSQGLFDELLSYPEVRQFWQAPIQEYWQLPLLTVNFIKAGRSLNFFSTMTTLGTPYDITLQELRLECLFPADEKTAQWFKTC
jgi:transcriptional regulator with XRE-family HTH domain